MNSGFSVQRKGIKMWEDERNFDIREELEQYDREAETDFGTIHMDTDCLGEEVYDEYGSDNDFYEDDEY
jgi:hypothetical protein